MGESYHPTAEEESEFSTRLSEAQQSESESPIEEPKLIDGRKVIWYPLEGSQEAFLSCPLFEALAHGTRGTGKSLTLLMSYAQYVGTGLGEDWRGVIFRTTYPQLADMIAKSQKWFPLIFPKAKYNKSKAEWRFENGELLMFRHMKTESDTDHHKGHELPFIGWEELTNWNTDAMYRQMMACCRSSNPAVPRLIRATTNPGGVGHFWVQDRFQLFGDNWRGVHVIEDPVDEVGNKEKPRAAIHGHYSENTILLESNPDYAQVIASSAPNEHTLRAWLDGDWNIVAGGMFSDVWDNQENLVNRFEIPHSWVIERAFDWGSAKPFSVGWYAISDGSDLEFPDGRVMATVRGDLFRVKEWYGSTGRPNEGLKMLATDVSKGIVEREIGWGWHHSRRVHIGVADSAIFKKEDGDSIADNMMKRVRIKGQLYPGVEWLPADKRPGSRKLGWEVVRTMMRDAHVIDGLPREKPGLFVVRDECPEFLRTVITLPRDDKDLDDVNTKVEDHIGDEVRYQCRAVLAGYLKTDVVGNY